MRRAQAASLFFSPIDQTLAPRKMQQEKKKAASRQPPKPLLRPPTTLYFTERVPSSVERTPLSSVAVFSPSLSIRERKGWGGEDKCRQGLFLGSSSPNMTCNTSLVKRYFVFSDPIPLPVSAFQALADTAIPSLPPFLHSTTSNPLSRSYPIRTPPPPPQLVQLHGG